MTIAGRSDSSAIVRTCPEAMVKGLAGSSRFAVKHLHDGDAARRAAADERLTRRAETPEPASRKYGRLRNDPARPRQTAPAS
jgi:hypothetical protein